MAEITQKSCRKAPVIITPTHTPHWETSEVGRKASRPGGKLVISRMRLNWREVSGGFWVREITLK